MKLARRHFAIAVAIAAGAATLAAQKVQITGAGATFPYPIYSKWFSEYNKLHPNVEINYQSIGSGGGVKQLTSQTVFFGASDYPLTPEQLLAAPGKILHFPTVLGAVVPIYNVPGVSAELKFTGPLLADIFLGNITKWNDSRIAKLNEGVTLPNSDITVVHRSDGSGTTYIFVDFLAKVSPEWKKRVGVAGSVNWPVGVGAKGNEAVAGMVKQTPGALGYTEPAYATENKIAFGTSAERGGQVHQGVRRIGHRRCRGCCKTDAGGFPRLDHESAGRRRLSRRLVHLAAHVRDSAGQGARQDHGGFHEVGLE